MQREDFIVAVDEDGTPATQQIAKIDKNHGEKIALVKFDGTAITTEGKLVRHNWFKGLNLNPAKYADILLTPEEARQIHAAQNRMKIGATSSTPLICYGGSVCPMAASCPFVQLQKQLDAEGEQRNVVPIGRTCPVETELLFEWVARYAEEFGVTDDPGNYTDQRVILELAECEVLEHRMNAVLAAKYQDLTEDKIVAVVYDENGEREQHVKDVADAMKVKEKIYTRKERLRKNLVATRYDQYKREAALNETNKVDAANLQADLRQKLQQIEAKIAGK